MRNIRLPVLTTVINKMMETLVTEEPHLHGKLMTLNLWSIHSRPQVIISPASVLDAQVFIQNAEVFLSLDSFLC